MFVVNIQFTLLLPTQSIAIASAIAGAAIPMDTLFLLVELFELISL